MTEQSYEQAVQLLRDRLGGQWEGSEPDGRAEMVRLLKDGLGYDDGAARSAIDAMVRTGRLRYRQPQGAGPVNEDSRTSAASPIITGPQATGSGLPAAPVASARAFAPGFWEIGEAGGDDALAGRKGQVVPS